jgi:hypothetical protein
MPRKTKAAQTQELDIIEIQDGIEVEPITNEYESAQDVDLAPQDSHKKELAKQAEIRRREAKKEEKYGTLTEKRLAALAKGREIARINREKKKLEFEEKLKSQMKLEMEQMLERVAPAEQRSSGSKNNDRVPNKHVKHKQPEPELSDSEEEQEMVQKEVKQKEVKQKDASQELNPPKAKHGVHLKDKVRPKEEKEFQPVRVITKQKFQEEAKKIVETSKKKMPIFKDEEKHSAKGKGRVIDFFKPHKVVYVSESEESD